MLYSLYLLNESGERVGRGMTLKAIDDRNAIARAMALEWDGPLELWQRARRVTRIDPGDGPLAA